MKRLLLLAALIMIGVRTAGFAQKTYELASPDGQIQLTVTAGNSLRFSLSANGQSLLTDCAIGVAEKRNDFSASSEQGVATSTEGEDLCASAVRKAKKSKGEETITTPFYRQSSFDVNWNALTLTFASGVQVEWRAYDEGVAYRFVLDGKGSRMIENEIADFHFAEDFTAYLPYSTNKKKPEAMAFQATYDVAPLSQQPTDNLAFLPLTIDAGGVKITLMESDVQDYPGMFVVPDGQSLLARFPQVPAAFDYYPWRQQKYVTQTEPFIARVEGGRTFPWRIIALSREDTEMPVNNLVHALAEPSRIDDTSWIQPGLVSWDWWNNWGLTGVPFTAGINNETYQYYIDFAARFGLPYVILDEGWYKPSSGDMLTTIDDIDLPLLVNYAGEKGVRLILWTVFNVLDAQLEEACQRYADMGIAGFKVDFVDRDDQEAQQMIWRIAEACARHHLILDYHGIAKPAGIQRTWPNILNFESCFGMEEAKWTAHDEKDMPAYDVSFPFIRLQTGYADFTPGGLRNATREDFQPVYKNPMTMGTRCHQLAMYIVYDSPLTMLADAPTNYEREADFTAFLAQLPTVFDETLIPLGRLGEYIVTARRKGDSWYVGGMTNWDGRDLQLPLSFLNPAQGSYTAIMYKDGVNAEQNASDYQVEQLTLSATDTLNIHLASGGGFLLQLKP